MTLDSIGNTINIEDVAEWVDLTAGTYTINSTGQASLSGGGAADVEYPFSLSVKYENSVKIYPLMGIYSKILTLHLLGIGDYYLVCALLYG